MLRYTLGGTVALDIDDIKSLGLADPDVIAVMYHSTIRRNEI